MGGGCSRIALLLLASACGIPATPSVTLDVQVEGMGATTPAPGRHVFTVGRTVQVEALPERGWVFRGWVGHAAGQGNPANLVMDADKTLTAQFEQVPTTYALKLSVSGSGTTTPGAGVHSHAAGTTVQVRAIPDREATFAGWEGAATGTENPVTVRMDSDKELTARFTAAPVPVPVTRTLTIAVIGSGATSPAAGTHTYPDGMVVEVTATPGDGAAFSKWTGAASGTSPKATVTMDADKAVTATFADAGFQPCPSDGTACRIMPLGDSITDGFNVPGGYRVELFRLAGVDRKAITFVGSGSNGPASVDGRQFPPQHEGHSGYRIDGIHQLVQGALTTHRPHVVLLMIGTNDVNGNADLANAPRRVELLLERITTTSPDALVVVAPIVPFRNAGRNPAVETYNAGVATVVQRGIAAGKHLVLVDMYRAFTSNPRYASELMADELHPSAAGHAVMARTWYEVIRQLLPARP